MSASRIVRTRRPNCGLPLTRATQSVRENNLIGSRHIRYGAYGGIAYHHIAGNYIALFISFIPCGVWQAVHILDGLLIKEPVRNPT